jgi:hypothetical protein
MTNKDKTVKIKAKYDCGAGGYKAGDVFEARLSRDEFMFRDNQDSPRHRYVKEFTIISEEPAIEVGSEWVSALKGHDNRELKVTATSNKMALLQWIDTGKEFAAQLSYFGNQYKPKPKTVTMYFYKDGGGNLCARPSTTTFPEILFTREIELP